MTAVSTPRLVLLVGLALVATCALAVGISEAFKHQRKTTTTLARHLERVVVDSDSGRVGMHGVEGDRVVVQRDAQWLWRAPRVRMVVAGATLHVMATCPRTGPANRCRADLDLGIPFDADVVVRNESGDVTAERLAGHIELHTKSGDVHGREMNPVSVRASTGAGLIDLDFTTEPVSVTATSNAGDVRVTVPRGAEYRVDTATKAGDDRVRGVVRNDRATRTIRASTDAGDVDVVGR
ncbi:MAG: DUF4097 domain-containing protein [Actinomycetota bacterium]|nr:DUF4097 domain-containing protein [Actinomycetota bacterium]